MRVQVIRAWPHRHELTELELPEGACVRDAVSAAGFAADAEIRGYAVFGEAVEADAAAGWASAHRLHSSSVVQDSNAGFFMEVLAIVAELPGPGRSVTDVRRLM